MIKNFADYPIIDGQNKYVSAVLGYNGLSSVDEYKNQYSSFYTYFSNMSHLTNEDKFLDYVKNNRDKKFCVIGDYDCDGIMATSIITYALTLCGYETTYTIPDRFEDGYGMHKRQIDMAISMGSNVIITVDNGICTNDVIDYAHEKGLYVIITDHHLPQGENRGDIVINPHYNNDSFKDISGATVAMKLAYQLFLNIPGIDEHIMKNFATMAFFTVYSDVMPMFGENRELSRAAFSFIDNEISNPESFIVRLADMLEFYDPKANSDPKLHLTSVMRSFTKDNLEYYLIPVINACNRVLGDVNDLVYDIMNLFVQPFDGIPHQYSEINKKRKYMKTELIQKHKKSDCKTVVEALTPDMWDDNYSGIVGLVAAHVAESENKPALIGIDVTNDDDIIHFSGRTVPGFNLYEALEQIKIEHPTLSLEFGGHADALGASCTKKDMPLLAEYLSQKFETSDVQSNEPVYISINNESCDNIIDAYITLWPYGNKFEFPKFYLKSKIKYLNKADYLFTVKNMNLPIRFFTKEIRDRIGDYAFNKRDEDMEMIVSLMEEGDQYSFKLEKLC